MNTRPIKKSRLQSKQICEFVTLCRQQECNGRNKDREGIFSCGLRRGFLIADGFKIEW